MNMLLKLFVFFIILDTLNGANSFPPRESYPQVVAHRGASGYIPEHSLQAYQTAIDLKADYVEPDLCLTKDGVFVAMHDVLLDDTTNVADFPEFASRYTKKNVEGKNMTGYFVSDFTVEEIKTLRLKQRLSVTRTKLYDGLFTIPTFNEIISLVQSYYSKTGILIGLYPELKEPVYHNSLGLYSARMEDLFLTQLTNQGYDITSQECTANNSTLRQFVCPILIQCFDASSLQYLRPKTSLPLLMLIDKTDASFWNEDNIASIASYANAIGGEKSFFENSPYSVAMDTVNLIHSYNLAFHPWTLRADMEIGLKFHGDFTKEEMYFYCCLGVDGMFTEFPDQTRETVHLMKNYTLWNSQSNNKCSISCTNP